MIFTTSEVNSMSNYQYTDQAEYTRRYKSKRLSQLYLPYNPETGERVLNTMSDLGIHSHHDFRSKYFTNDFKYKASHQLVWDSTIEKYLQQQIWCFRGGGKSVYFSRSYPLYYMLQDLNRSVLLITETDTLAKGYTSAIVEDILKNPLLNQDFKIAALLDITKGPKGYSAHTINFKRFIARKETTFKAAGLGSKIIGYHPDLIILDDIIQEGKSLLKREQIEDWFDQVVLPMRREHTQVLIIGTRKSPEDIYHYIKQKGTFYLTQQKAISGVIPHHQIMFDDNDMISNVVYFDKYYDRSDHKRKLVTWPERWTLDELLIIRHEMRPEKFAGEMQNEPVVASGIDFQRDWLKFYDFEDMFNNSVDTFRRMRIYMAVDIGGVQRNTDYSVISSIGAIGKNIYLLKNNFGHWRIPKLLRKVHDDYRHWYELGNKPIKVGIESNFMQRAIYDFLDDFSLLPVREIRQKIKKEIRIGALQTYFESQKVSLDPKSFGYQQFLNEYLNYPNVSRDDSLDAFEMAVGMASLPSPAHLGVYR